MRSLLVVVFLALLAATAIAAEEPPATVDITPHEVRWETQLDQEFVLTIARPDGVVLRRDFAAGEIPSFSVFDAAGQLLPDGVYTYELLAIPRFAPDVRQRLADARERGNERAVLAELRQAGKLPKAIVQSGSFVMESGSFIVAGLEEETGPRVAKEALRPVVAAAQVIPDDLIVQGSLCVGFDCVNNESFGSDTIRLKANNTRIKFEDTSVGTFPTNDWQLTANDSASGGSSKFSIEDITGAKVPFTITAGASTNSIFVDSTGRVGFRTSTPVLDLHINTSNTPAIRLEQNNSGGFPAQTWDIGANEANFFVRDVTGGSRLPLRIRPGAPTSSIDISADGDVGIGTTSPDVRVDAKVNTAGAVVLRLQNQNANGFSGIEFLEDSTTTETVEAFAGFVHSSNEFRLNAVQANPLTFRTANTERVRVNADGDVGIGTSAPGARLDVRASASGAATGRVQNSSGTGYSGFEYLDENSTVISFLGTDNAANNTRFNSIQNHPIVIMTESVERARVTSAGSIGIGTSTPSSKLHVNGGDIRVSGGSFIDDGFTLNAPDYVFEPGYELMPLAELAAFVRAEKHLPNVPNAAEIKASGLNLSQFQMRLLEKIEELTLYTLAQEEKIAALTAKIEALEAKE